MKQKPISSDFLFGFLIGMVLVFMVVVGFQIGVWIHG